MPNGNPMGLTKVTLGGKEYCLKLTNGACIEIEEHFDCSIDDLGAKLKKPRIKDLCIVIQALAGGGGNPISDAEIRDLDPFDMAGAVQQAFDAAEEKSGAGGRKKTSRKKR